MDLFEYEAGRHLKVSAPLAARVRPKTLHEFVGQQHICGKGKLLYRSIMADKLSSAIFFGPPGTGKTTLARIIANTTKSEFVQLNAVAAGIKDIRETVQGAKYTLGASGKKTVLFIDEIHRFNKTQQDALLPYVEDGTLILIGATTENPYFEVNKALVSRSVIFELFLLEKDEIKKILRDALTDKEDGMGVYNAEIDEDALDFLSDAANGDARTGLNAIELAVLTTDVNEQGVIHIDLAIAQECIRKRAIQYDKTGENHYDTISAFIKSMRGSDADAAIYYLARMLYAGEDPVFIARRIVICAAEDVGLADPMALTVAVSAMQGTLAIGLPEARILLSEAAAYVACAPKSNASYAALDLAAADVANIQIKGVPMHMRNAPVSEMKDLGRSIGYQYAHQFENHYVAQQHLPDELVGKQYLKLDGMGYEQNILAHFNTLGIQRTGTDKPTI